MSELLTCEGLTKHYGTKTALDGVDLHIGFGKIVGLLGPNGSGKTTLIKLANGLLQPDSGSIRIAGMKPGVESKAIVSYLPDADWLPGWMRVEQLVKMFGDFYKDFDPARANEMLANLEKIMSHTIDAAGEKYNTFINSIQSCYDIVNKNRRELSPGGNPASYAAPQQDADYDDDEA